MIMSEVSMYLDSKQAAVVLSPVAEHPVCAVTAGPVAVLAVGQVVPLHLLLHALLYPETHTSNIGKNHIGLLPDDFSGAFRLSVFKQAYQV